MELFCGLLVVMMVAAVASTDIEVIAHYPNTLPANSFLSLRGDSCGLNWDTGVKMISRIVTQDHVQYSATISCTDSSSSNLEVKVLINDKTWMIGSNHHISISSAAGNGTDHMYPWFFTTKGTLTTINKVYSSELQNFRDVIFYLPPSYNENTLKSYHNVLIMHDGQNLFNPATTAFGTAWMCQDTLDSLIVTGQSDEIMIVGPYNTNDRTNEYTYIYDPSEEAGGKGDLYLDWIESTLIPLVSSTYRVSIIRENLGILGSSLGGLISCYGGWTRVEKYGKVGCMSSSFWWDDNNYQKVVIVNQALNKSVALPVVYMDSGTEGGDGSCAVYTKQIYDYYLTQGFTADETVSMYIDQGGSHNEASWGARFYRPIIALYPPKTV